MDKLSKTPEGKAPAYYVVLRPKKLTPMQIDMMHPLAVLMMEQNAACVPLRPAASFEFLSAYCSCLLIPSPTRFKKRVPKIVKSLPVIVQKFIAVVCKQGVDNKKSIEVGNLGYDSGYDWCAKAFIQS
jgi:hypothetical protein